jgi:hypothetical protein
MQSSIHARIELTGQHPMPIAGGKTDDRVLDLVHRVQNQRLQEELRDALADLQSGHGRARQEQAPFHPGIRHYLFSS